MLNDINYSEQQRPVILTCKREPGRKKEIKFILKPKFWLCGFFFLMSNEKIKDSVDTGSCQFGCM